MNNFEKIHQYWFGNLEENIEPLSEKRKLWFTKSDETDKYISDNFGFLIEEYKDIDINNLKSNLNYLSFIIIFDQFTRNIFRNTPKSFYYDSIALNLTNIVIDKNIDKEFHPVKRLFIYLPLEHSENLKDQEKSVELFTEMEKNAEDTLKKEIGFYKDYAIKHYDIVKKFGRFPHRNKILGRETTKEEEEFLKLPGSSF